MLSRRIFLAPLLACGAGSALVAMPTMPSRVDATSSANRVVTIAPGPFAPQDMAEVKWSGYAPGEPVYLYICSVIGDGPSRLPQASECYGETLAVGTSDSKGSGSAMVEIRSRLTPQGLPSPSGTSTYQLGAPNNADCRYFGCEVVASQCSSAITDGWAASTGEYTLSPLPAGMPDWQSDDDYVTATEIYDEEFGLTDYIYTRIPYREPEGPPDPPSGAVPTGPRVLSAGSDSGSVIYNNWGRGVAGELNTSFGFLNLDYSEAIDDVISGERDIAFTAAPVLTGEQQATLAEKGQALVAVPVSVSTLGFGINAYPGLPLQGLKVSARSAAGFLYQDGQPGSDPAGIRSPEFTSNMGACTPTLPRAARPIIKDGNSDASYVLSSWLDGAASDVEWPFGAVDAIPNRYSQIALSHEAVVADTIKLQQADQLRLDLYARLGVMDTTWALRYDLPQALLENAAGVFVRPTPEGALATLASSPIGDDHIVDIDYNSPDRDAYPLVSVTYALASVNLSEEFTAEQADAVKAMLSYFISDTGQGLAEAEGYVPMPFNLRLSAANAIEQIGSVSPPPPPEESTTTTAATTTTPTTTAPASSSTSSAAPDSSSTSSSSSAPATTRPSSTQTTRPASPTGTTGPAATSPSGATTTAPGGDTGDDGSATTAPAAVVGAGDDELPPDEFTDDLGPLPSAPALPTLGAAGAAALVSGQGIALWRRQLRRSKFTPISP